MLYTMYPELEKVLRKVRSEGLARVVVDANGTAVPPHKALAILGAQSPEGTHIVMVDIIFLRKDGWSLGAPKRFEEVAYKLWKDQWIGFMRLQGPITQPRPISMYRTIN